MCLFRLNCRTWTWTNKAPVKVSLFNTFRSHVVVFSVCVRVFEGVVGCGWRYSKGSEVNTSGQTPERKWGKISGCFLRIFSRHNINC